MTVSFRNQFIRNKFSLIGQRTDSKRVVWLVRDEKELPKKWAESPESKAREVSEKPLLASSFCMWPIAPLS